MSEKRLERVSDMASEVHFKIQQDFTHINPVIGLSRGMRDMGFPADALTIDCLKTQRRIIIILHDETPDKIQYQFARRDSDPSDQYESIATNMLTKDLMYRWIVDYFNQDQN